MGHLFGHRKEWKYEFKMWMPFTGLASQNSVISQSSDRLAGATVPAAWDQDRSCFQWTATTTCCHARGLWRVCVGWPRNCRWPRLGTHCFLSGLWGIPQPLQGHRCFKNRVGVLRITYLKLKATLYYCGAFIWSGVHCTMIFLCVNQLWAPPTPPQDDNDVYLDQTMLFLHEPNVMPESQLPPVYVRKDHKKPRMETITSKCAMAKENVISGQCCGQGNAHWA